MILPIERRVVCQSLSDYNIILYGAPKIGKSSFAASMKKPLFLATEPGLNALSVYEVSVPDWATFLGACGEIAEGEHEFKTIVIDTVDNLYKACLEHVLAKHAITHESDMGFGKGYALVKGEFFRALKKLAMLPYGLVMTSHVQFDEIKTRVDTFSKAVPTLPKAAREIVLGWVDIILYADMLPGGDRILRTRPNERWIAGDRTEHAFGRVLPETLPLDFKEFEKAFYGGELS